MTYLGHERIVVVILKLIIVTVKIMVMNYVAGGKATAYSQSHRRPRLLLPRQDFVEKQGMLRGQEGGDHGNDGADGRAQIGRVHQVVHRLIFDEMTVFRGEKFAPFTHF